MPRPDKAGYSEGQATAAERMRQAASSDPTMTHLKIVNTESGEIIGQGKWFIRETDPEPKTLAGPYWRDEAHREYTQALAGVYYARRRRAANETHGKVYSTLHDYWLHIMLGDEGGDQASHLLGSFPSFDGRVPGSHSWHGA